LCATRIAPLVKSIMVREAWEKRALAEALADHDPEFLTDLKAMAGRFGAFESVEYQSDLHGPEVAKAFAERSKPHKAAHDAKVAEHMAAKRAIAADAVNNMRAILGAPRGT